MNLHLPIIGLDLSLTATGIATADGCHTIGSTGKADASLRARHTRLADLATRITLAASEAAAPRAALIVIEAPAYDSRTGHQHDRSGAWWLVVDELLSAGHLVAEVTTGGLKKYATGSGSAKKAAVVSAVSHRYGITFRDDNEADAYVLRAMGLHRYGHPLATVPKSHAAALDAVAWPDVDAFAGAA